MKLLVVESPAKAKTIGKYLGSEYVVRASVGHVRDLPKSNKKAIDIEGGFIPHYEISKGKEGVIAELKELAEKADEVLLATDPDREGEAIAWHIAEAVKLKKPKRVVFHEITEKAIREALKHPRDIDDKLKQAQEARRVLDRLVGYDLSGLIWKKVRYGLSAGRVQSPALRILMEREREIRAFVPEAYSVISAEVKGKSTAAFTVVCEEEPRDQKVTAKIVETAKGKPWKVLSVDETEAKRSPRAPFTTSTLQQTASSRLGFSPSRTMSVAQKLYEAGLITYMRTDSTTIGADAQAAIIALVTKKYGAKYAEARQYKTKSKNAQEAHEAVRVTDVLRESAGATDDAKKLYHLIWERVVSSQMADANTLRTRIAAGVEAKDFPAFHANGSRVLFDGWLKADPEARGEDVELPKVVAGESLDLLNLFTEEKSTEPPSRYTEAGLVKEMEKRGIGRPSTYASIIKTIQDRGYVEKNGKTLLPTDTGDVVSSFLEKNFEQYIGDDFTAEMENKLDDIANGDAAYLKTLKDFYGPFLKDVKSKDKIDKLTDLGPGPKEFPCPKCGSEMIIKLGKNGKFLSCSTYPDCDGARAIDGKEMEGPKFTGEKCPDCADGKLMERDGRYGRFIACSNYPKCKYIKESPEEEARKKTGVTCPTCGKGEMVERRGRFGIFYSCSNYPTCKNAIKAKPTGKICELCGSLMMEGTKTIPERCSNKACPNHNPHKIEKKKV
ncbi:type I DNA topoisomerase [Candidatus Parcubacteria bacterium]|nr:type I DNA topoisomerase [Candidatus Parcubacteria bacterium]